MLAVRSIAFFIYLTFPFLTDGQSIYSSHTVRYNHVSFVRAVADSHTYYLIPRGLRLCRDTMGEPLFTYQYFSDDEIIDSSNIKRATYGILQAAFEWDTVRSGYSLAFDSLRMKDLKARTAGFVQFDSCKISVVSSVFNAPDFKAEIRGTEQPLVKAGENVTITAIVKNIGAKIMLASLKTPTPDMSLMVESFLKTADYPPGNQAPVQAVLKFTFDENLGDLRIWENHFMKDKAPSGIDALFKSRNIYIIDEKRYNYYQPPNLLGIEVILKKTHKNGEFSFDEVRIMPGGKQMFRTDPILHYGWKADTTLKDWLTFDSRIRYLFKDHTEKKIENKQQILPYIIIKNQL